MCIPVAVAAGIAAVSGVASAGLSAYGAAQSGKAAKAQAQYNAGMQELQAKLSNYNADQAELYGKINSQMTLDIAGLNNKMTAGVADINSSLIHATTDFNMAAVKGATDFNVSSAEGAAKILDAQGKAEAATHDVNAQVYSFMADDTRAQGDQAERQSRAAYAQTKGQQRAALAANGVTLDEGSSLRIQSDTDYQSDVDASVIQATATKQALGYRIQASNENMQSSMASLSYGAQALDKRVGAAQARIQGDTAYFQAQIDGTLKSLDTKMTSTMQILQSDMDAQVGAFNITQQAKQDAFNARAQGLGFTAQAQQSRMQAASINPMLMAGTSLLGGLSQAFGSYAQMSQAGVFGAKTGTK